MKLNTLTIKIVDNLLYIGVFDQNVTITLFILQHLDTEAMQSFLKGGSVKVKDREAQAQTSSDVSAKDKSKRKAPQPWVEK